MAIPLVLMAAGTAMQIAGKYAANIDRAAAELQNAQWYNEQAKMYIEATERAKDITAKKYANAYGRQLGAAAKGGLNVGYGSIVDILAETTASRIEELAAVQRKGDLDLRLARMRQFQAENTAETLSSTAYNLTQGGATFLSNYAATEGFGTGFSAFGGSMPGGRQLKYFGARTGPETPTGYLGFSGNFGG